MWRTPHGAEGLVEKWAPGTPFPGNKMERFILAFLLSIRSIRSILDFPSYSYYYSLPLPLPIPFPFLFLFLFK